MLLKVQARPECDLNLYKPKKEINPILLKNSAFLLDLKLTCISKPFGSTHLCSVQKANQAYMCLVY